MNQHISKEVVIEFALVVAIGLIWSSGWAGLLWASHPIEDVVGGGSVTRMIIAMGGGVVWTIVLATGLQIYGKK